MNRLLVLLGSAALLMASTGCGNKGPLSLPPPPTLDETPAAEAEAAD